MIKLNEMDGFDRRELGDLLEAWLRPYTEDVIKDVMWKFKTEGIDDATMNLLRELKARQEKEADNRRSSFDCILSSYGRDDDDAAQAIINEIHAHCITHSKSYRDVLYDMHIGNRFTSTK